MRSFWFRPCVDVIERRSRLSLKSRTAGYTLPLKRWEIAQIPCRIGKSKRNLAIYPLMPILAVIIATKKTWFYVRIAMGSLAANPMPGFRYVPGVFISA
jgi:hypothetical protein